MDEAVAGDGQPGLIATYGQLHDEDLSETQRADRLADLLVALLADSGLEARRSTPLLDPHPAVAVYLDGVPYLIAVFWLAEPVTPAHVRSLQGAASGRPGLRVGLLSMSGFTAAARDVETGSDPVVVLVDRLHLEAVLCGLASAAAILGQAGHRALFDRVPYTRLTDLLIDHAARPELPGFATPDRLPAPWDLQSAVADDASVRHLLSGTEGWSEPLGIAVVDATRMLITTADGIIEVDLKRGTSHWLLPLPGCWGTPLPRPGAGVLTLCGGAAVEWKDGTLTPVAGDLADARALLTGPDGQPWALVGYGSGTATLALTRLGSKPGQQQRHSVYFDADVRTAGWLGDLRFFLAAAGNSAVVDLARSSGVRREDWIETPHHSPDHLVVVDPHSVITASPTGRGLGASIYRTDLTTGGSQLIAEVATNRVHGLVSTGAAGILLMLGDVRGNNIQTPHPVIVQINHERPMSTRLPSAPSAPAPIAPFPGTTTETETLQPAATTSACGAPSPTAAALAVDPFDAVRVAAQGRRRDYALDDRPIATGGQAAVFGARHKPTGLRVAFKKLTVHGGTPVARMRREVEAAQRFGDHPHVMPVLDFSPAYDWFAMPLADDSAQTLAAELTDPDQLRRLITAVCEALREPHQQGWIHRDVKPDNILKLANKWVIADWGLGRRPRGLTTDPQRTRTGGPFGTAGFAAPELSINAHTVTPQADIYSIGQIIGWALTRTWPQANVPLMPPAGPWRTVAKAATNVDPARRPSTVDELLTLISREFDVPPELPVNRGKTLLAAVSRGDKTAPAALFDLAASAHADYELYLGVLVNLDDHQIHAAVAANPPTACEVVKAIEDLHTGGYVTLEYGDVDQLITWLLMIAHHAEQISEWDLLEDTANSIFYLDLWDRWRVQDHIRTWLASRTGHAASIAAGALRRNPDVRPHFSELAQRSDVDHRIREAITT
jgi:serine/threonine protein kinase